MSSYLSIHSYLFSLGAHIGHLNVDSYDDVCYFILGTRCFFTVFDLKKTIPLLKNALLFFEHVISNFGLSLFCYSGVGFLNSHIRNLLYVKIKKINQSFSYWNWAPGCITNYRFVFLRLVNVLFRTSYVRWIRNRKSVNSNLLSYSFYNKCKLSNIINYFLLRSTHISKVYSFFISYRSFLLRDTFDSIHSKFLSLHTFMLKLPKFIHVLKRRQSNNKHKKNADFIPFRTNDKNYYWNVIGIGRRLHSLNINSGKRMVFFKSRIHKKLHFIRTLRRLTFNSNNKYSFLKLLGYYCLFFLRCNSFRTVANRSLFRKASIFLRFFKDIDKMNIKKHTDIIKKKIINKKKNILKLEIKADPSERVKLVEHYKQFWTFSNYIPLQRLRVWKPFLTDLDYMRMKGVLNDIINISLPTEKPLTKDEEINVMLHDDELKRQEMVDHYKKFGTFNNYKPFQLLSKSRPEIDDFGYMKLKGIDHRILKSEQKKTSETDNLVIDADDIRRQELAEYYKKFGTFKNHPLYKRSKKRKPNLKWNDDLFIRLQGLVLLLNWNYGTFSKEEEKHVEEEAKPIIHEDELKRQQMIEHYKQFGTFENYIPFQRLKVRKPDLNDASYMSLKGITHVIARLKLHEFKKDKNVKSVSKDKEKEIIMNGNELKRQQMIEHYKQFGTFESYIPFQRLKVRKPDLNDASYMSLKGITHSIAKLKLNTEISIANDAKILPIRHEDDIKREQMIEHYKKFRTFSNYIPYQRLKMRKPNLNDFGYMRLKGIEFLIPRHLRKNRGRKNFRFKFRPFLSHKAINKMKSFYVYRNKIKRSLLRKRYFLKKKISVSELITIIRLFFSSNKKYYQPFIRLVNSIIIRIKKEKMELNDLIKHNKYILAQRDRPEHYRQSNRSVSNRQTSDLNSRDTIKESHDKQPWRSYKKDARSDSHITENNNSISKHVNYSIGNKSAVLSEQIHTSFVTNKKKSFSVRNRIKAMRKKNKAILKHLFTVNKSLFNTRKWLDRKHHWASSRLVHIKAAQSRNRTLWNNKWRFANYFFPFTKKKRRARASVRSISRKRSMKRVNMVRLFKNKKKRLDNRILSTRLKFARRLKINNRRRKKRMQRHSRSLLGRSSNKLRTNRKFFVSRKLRRKLSRFSMNRVNLFKSLPSFLSFFIRLFYLTKSKLDELILELRNSDTAIRSAFGRLLRFWRAIIFFKCFKKTANLPDCVVMLNPNNTSALMNDFLCVGIPIIGVADSNSDITHFTYPIPSNDDSIILLLFYFLLFINACEFSISNRYLSFY
jgi:ribosomal protein S2